MSSRTIHPERQSDAIRFGRLQATNSGLRDRRENYLQDWSNRPVKAIQEEIERLRGRVVENFDGFPEGDLLGESWRVAALQTALTVSSNKRTRQQRPAVLGQSIGSTKGSQ